MWNSPFSSHAKSQPPTQECVKSPEIEVLQRKLRESEAKFTKLEAEIEQRYIKDEADINTVSSLEYIEKLGCHEVKYYESKYIVSNHMYCPSFSVEKILEHQWSAATCVNLRDFLVKNFPLEANDD